MSKPPTHDQVAVAAELAKQEQLQQAGGSDYLNAVASGLAGRSATWLRQAERVQALAVLRRVKEAAVHIEDLATANRSA
ncbi:hypothetical protein [Streptomyces sp. NPDC006510]|uniref:hypothetical protein n=1 Tax=Streptomyces sp. NPDC006510 TaxID=3155600 RepID=UPI0033AC6F7E